MIPFQNELIGGVVALGIIGSLYVSNEFKDSEIARLEANIASQNMAIEYMAVDRDAREKEFLSIKPKIKKIYVDRFLTDANMTRGNCEDVENILNNIDELGLF